MLKNLRRLLIYRWKHFRIPEHVADAVRNTVLVLVPLLLLYKSNQQAALGMAVGVLLISLTDLPGNRRSKLLTAIQSLSTNLIVSLVFSLCLPYPIYTGIALVSITFILSMLSAFGVRSNTSGAMGIALMVFMLGLHPPHPLQFSLFIMLGGIWFYLVSLVQVFILPYRSLYQALREVLASTADFLEAKAASYNPCVPLDESYRRTISLHLRVAEKQELVRSILLSDSYAMREAGPHVQKLISVSISAIKLYEQVTATHYDYAEVQQRLEQSGALTIAANIMNLQAEEIKWLSKVVPLNKTFNPPVKKEQYEVLLQKLSNIAGQLPASEANVINGLLTNVRAVMQLLDDIRTLKAQSIDMKGGRWHVFLSDSDNYRRRLLAQLHFKAPVLRFSLRLALLFAIAYVCVFLIIKHTYAYWLLLTILIVLRPRLAVTWQRNLERLAGTIAGVVIASVLLFFTGAPIVILPIAALALTGFFAWNRNNYSFSVCCVTVAIVLSLSAYRGEPLSILVARIGYTLAGCALAFAGTFVFPVWVNSRLDELARSAVEGNVKFLRAVISSDEQTNVWLARKEAHLSLARFSEGLRHARVEPGKYDIPKLEQVQVLNYRINSIIISLFLSGRRYEDAASIEILNSTLTNLGNYNDGIQQSKPVAVTKADGSLTKGIGLLENLSWELSKLI